MASKATPAGAGSKKAADPANGEAMALRRRSLSTAGLDAGSDHGKSTAKLAKRMRESGFSFVTVPHPPAGATASARRAGGSAVTRSAAAALPLAELFELAVDAYADVSPGMRMDIERNGLAPEYIQQLADVLGLPFTRLCAVLGLPRSTIAKKVATRAPITGASAHAALGVFLLLARVRRMLAQSTAAPAAFDAGRWLGNWIETPQNALAGRKPADVLDTPTGFEVVKRTLGAIESGAYA